MLDSESKCVIDDVCQFPPWRLLRLLCISAAYEKEQKILGRVWGISVHYRSCALQLLNVFLIQATWRMSNSRIQMSLKSQASVDGCGVFVLRSFARYLKIHDEGPSWLLISVEVLITSALRSHHLCAMYFPFGWMCLAWIFIYCRAVALCSK